MSLSAKLREYEGSEDTRSDIPTREHTVHLQIYIRPPDEF